MIVPLKYTYLVGTLILLIPWAILYWHRKDLRGEMVVMSLAIAIGSFLTGYFWWTVDWWSPQTITGTRVGIEDLLLGFSNGGIAAVLYEELFKRRLYKFKHSEHNLGAAIIAVSLALIIWFLFRFLGFTSFVSSTIGMVIVGTVLMILRRDLFADAILTAISAVVAAIPLYFILEYLTPGFIEKTWLFATLSGVKFFIIPIEELVFYFLFGFIIAPFYHYWKGERLRKIPVSK